MRAVAYHQPSTLFLALVAELREIGLHLGLQCLGQHAAGPLTHDLVDQRQRVGPTRWTGTIGSSGSSNCGEYGSYLPDLRWRADLA